MQCAPLEAGIRALRVPFDRFAAHVRTADGQYVTPLQLVVDAVRVTHEFSIFGSKNMEVLLQFKWGGL